MKCRRTFSGMMAAQKRVCGEETYRRAAAVTRKAETAWFRLEYTYLFAVVTVSALATQTAYTKLCLLGGWVSGQVCVRIYINLRPLPHYRMHAFCCACFCFSMFWHILFVSLHSWPRRFLYGPSKLRLSYVHIFWFYRPCRDDFLFLDTNVGVEMFLF